MTTPHFTLRLKERLSPASAWPNVVAALRQEQRVWDSLFGSPVFQEKALSELAADPGAWTPAAISLLTLEDAPSLEWLVEQPLQPLPQPLRGRAQRVYEGWEASPHGQPLTLSDCALLALSLRERRRLKGSWEGLAEDLEDFPESGCLIACLAGMAADPAELLAALLTESVPQPWLAVHAALCDPRGEEAQYALLDEALAHAAPSQQLALTLELAAQRPNLARRLSQEIRASLPTGKHLTSTCELGDLPEALTQAELAQLSPEPADAAAWLGAVLGSTRKLQARLEGKRARVLAAQGEPAQALDAWQNAVRLDPSQPVLSAELALAWLNEGRIHEAQAFLAKMPPESALSRHLAVRLATARVAQRMDEPDLAAQAAAQAFEAAGAAESGNSAAASDRLRFLAGLADALFSLGQARLAGRALRLATAAIPTHPALLALEAQIYLAQNHAYDAVASASAAQAIALITGSTPQALSLLAPVAVGQTGPWREAAGLLSVQVDLDRLWVESLEAAGEWEAAYQEHTCRLENPLEHTTEALQAMANCALKAGYPQVAARACRESLILSPENGLSLGLLGEASLAQGEIEDALECFQGAIRFTPQEGRLWLSLAEAYRRRDQSARAQEALRAGSLAAPFAPEIHFELGRNFLAEGLPTQALAPLQRAAELLQTPQGNSPIRVDPSLARRVALHIGQALHHLGRLEEARQVYARAYEGFDAAARQDPEFCYAYAKTLCVLGMNEKALPLLEVAVLAQPSQPDPYLDYARALLLSPDQPRQAHQAIPYLQKVLDLKPEGQNETESILLRDPSATPNGSKAEAQALLGEAHTTSGDYPEAMQAFQKAIRLSAASEPSFPAAWRARLGLGLGRAALANQESEAAITALLDASHLEPLNPAIQRSLSEAYFSAGMLQDAFAAAQAALQTHPNDPEMLGWFAETGLKLVGTGSGLPPALRQEALAAVERAVLTLPDRADLLSSLGKTQMEHGQAALALETFRKLATSPGAAAVQLYAAAGSLRQGGDWASAAQALERAITRYPEENQGLPPRADLYVELSQAFGKSGQNEAAIQALQGAMSIRPQDPTLALNKSGLLMQVSQPEAALVCIEDALELNPDHRSLRLQAVLLLRSLGDWRAALIHAERAIPPAGRPQSTPDAIQAVLLAAELARSGLQPGMAQSILSTWQMERLSATGGELAFDDPLTQTDLPDLICLQGELALENGNREAAERAYVEAMDLCPSHPRLLALHARLTTRSGKRDEAARLLLLAARSLDEPERRTTPCLRAVGEAALELEDWEVARTLLQQAVALSPREPLAQVLLARLLALQAERARLCHLTDVVAHLPGKDVLSKETYDQFQNAIQAAEKESTQDGQAELPFPVLRWKARGDFAFQPGAETASRLGEMVKMAPPDVDDIVAWIGALGRQSSLSEAGRVAQAYAQHPSVLLRLALCLAPTDARRALTLVNTAAALINRHGDATTTTAPLVHYVLARLHLAAGQHSEQISSARQAISAALGYWPAEPRWQSLAAEIAAGAGQPNEAITYLLEAIRLEPDYGLHYHALGKVYQAEDDLLQAVANFRKACDLEPSLPELWLDLAQARMETGDLDGAADSADQAIESLTDPTPALLLRGEIALQANYPSGALSRAQIILRENPDHPAALFLLARALTRLDEPLEALNAIEKAIGQSTDPRRYQLERARILRRLPASAKSSGRKDLPNADAAASTLGELQALAERYPQEPAFLVPLAELLAETGQDENAFQTARLALQSNGKLDAADQAMMHLLVGRPLRQSGQLDQAIHHLSEAMNLAPNRLEPALELCQALHESRQHAQALKVIEKAIALAPEDYRPYFHAGLVLKETKDYLGAEEMLRRAARLAPTEVAIHRMLGAVVALNLVHNRNKTYTHQEKP